MNFKALGVNNTMVGLTPNFFCFLAGKRENTSKEIIDKDGISRNIKDSVGVNYTMDFFTPTHGQAP